MISLPIQPPALHYKFMETFYKEQWPPWVILNITLSPPPALLSLIVPETVSVTAGLLMNQGGTPGKMKGDFRLGKAWDNPTYERFCCCRFWDKVSCVTGWPQIRMHCPECWNYMCLLLHLTDVVPGAEPRVLGPVRQAPPTELHPQTNPQVYSSKKSNRVCSANRKSGAGCDGF